MSDGKDEVEAYLLSERITINDEAGSGGWTLTRMRTTRTAYRPRGDMVCMEGEGKELERGRIGVAA